MGSNRPSNLTRRELIGWAARLAGVSAAVSLLEACGQAAPPPAPTKPAAPPAAAAAPTAAPAAPTAAPTKPAAAPTTAPAAAPAATTAPAPTAAPAVATKPAGAPKGEIVVGHNETIPTMDPQMHTSITTYNVNLLVFDPLIWKNPQNDKLEPALATSWEPVDERTWKFTLRKGVKFHNGEPFNAKSVKFTLERVSDPAQKSPQKWVPPMRVETPDEYTAIVRLEDPFAPFINTMAGAPYSMMDPKTTASSDQARSPIGTGPFKFTSWQQGSLLTLDANPDYWGGPPKVKRILWRQITETAIRVGALEAGEVTLIDSLAPEDKARLEKDARFQIVERPINEVRHLIINNERKPFSDKRVRQAIAHAINVDGLVKNNMLNSVDRAIGPIPPALFGSYTGVTARAYDPDKARKLLAEAGLGNGLEAELLYYTGNVYPKDDEVALAMAADLGKAGIKVRLQALEIQTAIERTAKADFDLSLQGTSNATGDIHMSINRDYHTPNRPHYSNPAFDKLIDQGRMETNPDKRKEIYKQAIEILQEDMPNVWLFWVKNATAYDKRLKGFYADSGRIIKLRDCWLEG